MGLLARIMGSEAAAEPKLSNLIELQATLGETQLRLESAEADVREADAKLATVDVRGNFEALEGWTERRRSLGNAVIAHQTQIAELEKAVEAAERDAWVEDLEERRAEALAYSKKSYRREIAEWQKLADAARAAADKIITKEQAHDALAREIKEAGLEPLLALAWLHGDPERIIEPEREVVEHVWCVFDSGGVERGVCVFHGDGKPVEAGAFKKPVTRKIPAEIKPARPFDTMQARRNTGRA